MYFFNTKLEGLEIIKAKNRIFPLNNNKKEVRSYQFDINMYQFPEIDYVSFVINTKNRDHILYKRGEKIKLTFDIMLKTKTNPNVLKEKFKKYIQRRDFLSYFFQNIEDVKINDLNKNRLIKYDLAFSLIGKPKIEIFEEFNFCYLCNYEPSFRNLKNKDIINYLLVNNSMFKKDFNYIKKDHVILNELTQQFDINSEDFLEALQLYYSN